ncbi:MAG: hypothetical protein OXM88_09340 [bacterium]|nr:hypothetical protein [bacterium]
MPFSEYRQLTIDPARFGLFGTAPAGLGRQVGVTVVVRMVRTDGLTEPVWLDGRPIQVGTISTSTVTDSPVVASLIPSTFLPGTYYEVELIGLSGPRSRLKVAMPDGNTDLDPEDIPFSVGNYKE